MFTKNFLQLFNKKFYFIHVDSMSYNPLVDDVITHAFVKFRRQMVQLRKALYLSHAGKKELIRSEKLLEDVGDVSKNRCVKKR